MEKEIKNMILLGENVNTELKEAKHGLPQSVFETVCSFLNTSGGYIFLGVKDKDKEIVGVNPDLIDKMKKEFSEQCNNQEVIKPTIFAELKDVRIDGKVILYTHIEESTDIHKCKGKVYIRNYEGDFDISDNIPLIASIHNKKRKIFEEDMVYPYVSVEKDLRHDLIEKARKLANSNVTKRHIWMDMSDLELLKSAGLYKRDKENSKEGVTLAGVMLFGRDDVIANVNPYCRTDALYRKDDLDRYDDRDFVETNLIDMYDRLLDFIAKYTMDRFALDEKARRISPRNIMAREIVINTLMHRDITDGHTSRIIIYKDKLICENPNSFRTNEILNVNNYTPFAKNPTLAKFFREIGYADELGSGFIKITKNSLLYSGKPPVFEDKEMFRVAIPLLRDEKIDEKDIIKMSNGTLNGTLNDTLNDTLKLILGEIKNNSNIKQAEISEKTGYSLRTIKRATDELQERGYIKRVGAKKNGHWKILK